MGIYEDINHKLFSGAGVLVIGEYKNKLCVMLTRNKSSHKYSDFGGAYETRHKTLEETAHRELREESRNLFNISFDKFDKYVDIPAGTRYFYRVFIIKINDVDQKYFKHNREIIDKSNAPRYWKETDRITWIPIENLTKDSQILDKRGDIKVKDINDESIIIHVRAKKAIAYFIEKFGNNLKSIKVIANKSNLIIHDSSVFHNKTYSFKV